MAEDNRQNRKKQESNYKSAYLADHCYLHLKELLGQLNPDPVGARSWLLYNWSH